MKQSLVSGVVLKVFLEGSQWKSKDLHTGSDQAHESGCRVLKDAYTIQIHPN